MYVQKHSPTLVGVINPFGLVMMKRELRIELRVTKEEKKLLQDRADKTGVSIGEYIRIKALQIEDNLTFKGENKNLERVYITLPEKNKLKERAIKLGFSSLSEYIRALIYNKRIITKTDVSTIIQLRKIGVNINQIAHNLNADPTRKISQSDIYLLEELGKILKLFIDKIQE